MASASYLSSAKVLWDDKTYAGRTKTRPRARAALSQNWKGQGLLCFAAQNRSWLSKGLQPLGAEGQVAPSRQLEAESFPVQGEEQAKSSAEATALSSGGCICRELPLERQRPPEAQKPPCGSRAHPERQTFVRASQGMYQRGLLQSQVP